MIFLLSTIRRRGQGPPGLPRKYDYDVEDRNRTVFKNSKQNLNPIIILSDTVVNVLNVVLALIIKQNPYRYPQVYINKPRKQRNVTRVVILNSID